MSGTISILRGDITRQQVDAIVNAANNSLLGGGGVDGAIHSAAGSQLLEECRGLGGCATGSARITKGYLLPAKWIIHTVGPVWHGGTGGEDELLASSYRASLELAEAHEIRSLAFPSISTGAYGFPLERAAGIAIRVIAAYVTGHDLPSEVRMVCFDQRTYEAYTSALAGQRASSGKEPGGHK